MKETFVGNYIDEIYEKITKKYGDDFEILESRNILVNSENCYEITIGISKDLFYANSFGSKVISEIKDFKTDLNVYKEVKESFVNNGIDGNWIDKIFSLLEEDIDDKNLLEQYILEEIESSLKISPENIKTPKVIMLAGTTGVGKTTTLAKIAARYGYMMSQPYSIALINLDHYRIGAAEQLKTYAQMMQIPYHNAYNNEEFINVVDGLDGIDVILVDTAGASPFDIEKILQTSTFLAEYRDIDISVFLVLSASLKLQDLKEIYESFSFLDLSGIIVSKLDETNYVGSIINFLMNCPTPIAYFSTGQEVPDDMEVATSSYLIDRLKKEINTL